MKISLHVKKNFLINSEGKCQILFLQFDWLPEQTAVTIRLQSVFDRGHYLTAVAYLTTVTNPKKYLEIRQFVYIDFALFSIEKLRKD